MRRLIRAAVEDITTLAAKELEAQVHTQIIKHNLRDGELEGAKRSLRRKKKPKKRSAINRLKQEGYS